MAPAPPRLQRAPDPQAPCSGFPSTGGHEREQQPLPRARWAGPSLEVTGMQSRRPQAGTHPSSGPESRHRAPRTLAPPHPLAPLPWHAQVSRSPQAPGTDGLGCGGHRGPQPAGVHVDARAPLPHLKRTLSLERSQCGLCRPTHRPPPRPRGSGGVLAVLASLAPRHGLPRHLGGSQPFQHSWLKTGLVSAGGALPPSAGGPSPGPAMEQPRDSSEGSAPHPRFTPAPLTATASRAGQGRAGRPPRG